MSEHPYPKKYLVGGVSAELIRGNENTIFTPVFFIIRDGKAFYASHAKDWVESGLKPLAAMDEEYVCWFPDDERLGINEHEVVYLAGADIMRTLQGLVAEGLLNFSFSQWKELSIGYHGTVMTHAAYHAFAVSLKNKVWEILERYITDRPGQILTPAEDIFQAYSSLYIENADKKEIALNRGAYFMAMGNTKQLAFESFLATLGDGRIFSTEDAFLEASTQRLAAIKNP